MELTPETLVALYQSVPDPPPLRGLRGVDWSAVRHAHGPATDTPALLRALMSDNKRHRRFACQLLFETIWHQGNIYTATVPAIPFLYNLLETDGPHDKGAIAHLIATIANGEPSFAMCEGNPQETAQWEAILRNVGRSLRDEMAAGRMAAEDVRRAVSDRLDVLYPYLRDPEPEMRRSVAVAIGRFPAIATRLLPNLDAAQRDETDKYARAALEEIIRQTKRPT